MHTLRKASIRSAAVAATFAASALLTVGSGAATAVAPGDYCNYADGTVYCGTEEFIYEGDPALHECVQRWERASWSCP